MFLTASEIMELARIEGAMMETVNRLTEFDRQQYAVAPTEQKEQALASWRRAQIAAARRLTKSRL